MDIPEDMSLKFFSEYRLIDQIYEEEEDESTNETNVADAEVSGNIDKQVHSHSENNLNPIISSTNDSSKQKNKIPTKNSPSIKQTVSLFPESRVWNFRNLSCFLNEHDQFVKRKRRSYQKYTDKKGQVVAEFTFYHREKQDYKISVTISNVIEVTASVQYVFKKWERHS